MQTLDFLDFVLLMWRKKVVLLLCGVGMAIAGALISFLFDETYVSQTTLQIVDTSSKGQGFSGLGGQLGGLANLAGVDLAGDTSAEATLAILKSRELVSKFIKQNKLAPLLLKKAESARQSKEAGGGDAEGYSIWDAHSVFTRKVMSVQKDQKTGLVTLSMRWTSPVVAARWNADYIALANETLQKEALEVTTNNLEYLQNVLVDTPVADLRASVSSMISAELERAMLANVSKEYALKILDQPSIPDLDNPSSPNRLIFSFLGGVVGVVFSMAFILFRLLIIQKKD